MGSSLGGLFTLYTLFQETALFNRYVLTSPAIGWDDEVIESYVKNYAPKKSQLPSGCSWLSAGWRERDCVREICRPSEGKEVRGLEIETRVLEGSGHSGGKAEGYSRGLQFVFAKPFVAVDAAVLDQYAGTYQVNPEFKIKVVRKRISLLPSPPMVQNWRFSRRARKTFI